MVNDKKVTRDLFKIGDWVQVKALTSFIHHDSKRVVEKIATPSCGQIVGVAVRMEGTIECSYNPMDGDDPPHLEVSAQHELWEIRLGMKNKPVLAFEEDITPCSIGKLPWLKTKGFAWTEKDRAVLREIMSDWPRNAKGYWQKAEK